MSDIVEDLVDLHNKALARGEDHSNFLKKVDGWVTDYSFRSGRDREQVALDFEGKGLDTDLSREMLRAIRGRD
jgi:hypothetical protein